MLRSYIRNKKARELSDNNTKVIYDIKLQKYHVSYGFYHIIDIEDKYPQLDEYIVNFVRSRHRELIDSIQQKLDRINSSQKMLGTRRAASMLRKTLNLYTNPDDILMNVNINIDYILKDYIIQNFTVITDVVNVTKYGFRVTGNFGEFLIKAISDNINTRKAYLYEINPTASYKLYVYNVYMFISYASIYDCSFIKEFAANSIYTDSLFDDENVKATINNGRSTIAKAKATLLTIAADEEYSEYFNNYIRDLYISIGIIFIRNIDKINDYSRFCNLLIEHYNIRPYSEVSVTV